MATTNEWINLPELHCQFSGGKKVEAPTLQPHFMLSNLWFTISFFLSFFLSRSLSFFFSKAFLFIFLEGLLGWLALDEENPHRHQENVGHVLLVNVTSAEVRQMWSTSVRRSWCWGVWSRSEAAATEQQVPQGPSRSLKVKFQSVQNMCVTSGPSAPPFSPHRVLLECGRSLSYLKGS